MSLFQPDRHERLSGARWDAGLARQAIDAIVRDCEERFSSGRLWPPHPLDAAGDEAPAPHTMLYLGAAGTIWALDDLARRGLASQTGWFADALAELESLNLREIGHPPEGIESYLIGRSGVLLTRYRVQPAPEIAERLAQSIAVNMQNPTRELLWGAPGTMHAALAMHEWTGERRWAELYGAGAGSLAASLERHGRCELWQQEIWGYRLVMLGAAHGYAGNAGAIIRGLSLLERAERETWTDRIVAATLATAQRDGPLVNWPPEWPVSGRTKWLVQWCHGAPGFVASLGSLADPRLDEVLAAAGELIWAAGPLRKGAGFCHGTAGNGYAFLKLFARTGDPLWLDRARSFAMHAIEQSEAHAASYGMRRYSLYTGDPGLAIYLARCIDGRADWPSLDPES